MEVSEVSEGEEERMMSKLLEKGKGGEEGTPEDNAHDKTTSSRERVPCL